MKVLCWVLMLASTPSFAATYYVDITNGSDANSGTAKTTAWAHAPGMNNVAGIAKSTTIKPGDSIILRGCQIWGNASFPWTSPASGSSGFQIYIGVDKTWYDSTVSGCASSWNRPVLNPGATSVNHGTGAARIILDTNAYITWDDFEVTNVLCEDDAAGTSNETHIFDIYGAPDDAGVIIENMYIHGWVNLYFSVGTGNVTSGSYVVSNYVPYSYSPSPLTSWPGSAYQLSLQEINPFGSIPIGNNSPLVTSITGTNPYSITFSNTAGPATSTCTGCVVQMGEDQCRIFAGNEAGNDTVVQNNVIDGSDTVEAQYNPYGDCGASEGNNNWCGTSAAAQWRGPQIWRNNVIRYVQSVAVGACTEWSGNLIEYIRISTNPTGHTNGIECLDEIPINGATLSYNNVIRHTNDPNASSANGQGSIGLLNQYTPQSGTTAYVFNNVIYDTLQNAPLGLYSLGNGCCGTVVLFNNTVDGGPAWSTRNYDLTNKCPSAYNTCVFQNNHLVSNISSSLSVLNSCGSNCTHTTNLLQSFSAASGQGYSLSQTYAYFPTTGGATIGAGTSSSSICSAISSANSAAGAACLGDTSYGALYNLTAHTAIAGARSMVTRGPTYDIGAYQFSSVQPPTGLSISVQ